MEATTAGTRAAAGLAMFTKSDSENNWLKSFESIMRWYWDNVQKLYFYLNANSKLHGSKCVTDFASFWFCPLWLVAAVMKRFNMQLMSDQWFNYRKLSTPWNKFSRGKLNFLLVSFRSPKIITFWSKCKNYQFKINERLIVEFVSITHLFIHCLGH